MSSGEFDVLRTKRKRKSIRKAVYPSYRRNELFFFFIQLEMYLTYLKVFGLALEEDGSPEEKSIYLCWCARRAGANQMPAVLW